MKRIEGTLNRPYPIVICQHYENLVEEVKKYISPSKVCIITDTNVEKLYLEEIKQRLNAIAPVIVHCFPAGEHAKHLETVQEVYNTLLMNHMDRSGLIVALGGGVVGDLSGFVASSYMRGIPFIQLPTTIVAQNDSSMGGKVGVDYFAHKNMVGAFYNPILVYTNISTLHTLPDREFEGGMSEVIKHGIIQDDYLYSYLMKNKEEILSREEMALEEMTYLSCLVKAHVVECDLKELGMRKILNFGHTIGHAIETLSNFRLNHGECVAYGMVMATFMSYKRNYVKEEVLMSVEKICRSYGLLAPFPKFDTEQVLKQMLYDKKKAHGKITFILVDQIGKARSVNDVSEEEICEALEYISQTCL